MEEQLRTLIVDIVRSCQSTVAHNWELGNVSSADTRVSAQRASQDVYVTHVVEHETSESSTAIASNSNLDEFVKAPELADGGILPASAISHCQDDDLPQTSKTGYESLFDQNCQCPCHEASGLSSTLGGRLSLRLGVCTYTNFLSQAVSARAALPTISTLNFRIFMTPLNSSPNETVI